MRVEKNSKNCLGWCEENKTVKTPLRWSEVYDLFVKTMSDAAWERALAAQTHSPRICSKSLTTLRQKQRSSSSKTGCAERGYYLTRMTMNGVMNSKHKSTAACSLNRYLKWDKNRKNTAALVWIWCILHHLWLPGCYSSLRASSHSHNTHQPDSKLRLESQTTLQKKQRSSNSKTACGKTAILIDDSVQPCFSMSVANDVFSDGNIKGSG